MNTSALPSRNEATARRRGRVLVVDDEAPITELLSTALRYMGYEVATAATGNAALESASKSPPDLVVLDVMLPDIDGFEVCRRLRSAGNDVPVIFLTARDTSSDTVTGLALGGDDYVTKPFSVEALVARVRAVLRRASRSVPAQGAEADTDPVLRIGDLELDESRWTVHRSGVLVDLSPTEFRLLAYLVAHAGQLVTHRQILGEVWGAGYDRDVHLLRMTIRNLRLRLDVAAPGEPYITTEYGLGYRLSAPAEDRPTAGST